MIRSATSVRATTARHAALALLLLGALGGCAVLPGLDGRPRSLVDDRESADAVARNLVLALVQLPELDPRTTTVQIGAIASTLERAVVSRLVDAGYGLQEVKSDQGLNFVRVTARFVQSEAGRWETYRLAVGGIALERDFERGGGGVAPRSGLRVEGVEPVALVLDDRDLAPGTAPAASVEFVPHVVLPVETPVTGVGPGPEGADGEAPRDAGSDEPALVAAAPPGNPATRANLFGTMSSYAETFAAYQTERSAILIFPNDSARLEGDNARVIRSFAAALDPATDVISLIGCSFGRTSVDEGNAALANARADTVKAALLEAGVAAGVIRDFACWSSRYHRHLPTRGVVIELQRAIRPS